MPIVFELRFSGPCNQYSDEETPVFSEEGKLLVQIGHDVFLSIQEERDIRCLEWTLSSLPPFSRIHLEVRHPVGLRALSNAVMSGTLAQQDFAKVRVFKVDFTATLKSTPDDLATVFRALTRIRDVQLFVPKCSPGSIYLPHKRIVQFHLAGQTIVGVANREPVATFETNIRGTWLLLEAARQTPTVRSQAAAQSRVGPRLSGQSILQPPAGAVDKP